MPIRPEYRKFYTAAAGWPATRRRILERAGGRFNAKGRYLGGAKCEQCGKPDRRQVWVYRSPSNGQYWTQFTRRGQKWHYCLLGGATGSFGLFGARQWKLARRIRVVLTIGHLNHTPGDDRDENLKALCQWCHFHHDKAHHKQTRCIRKDAARPLIQGAIAV